MHDPEQNGRGSIWLISKVCLDRVSAVLIALAVHKPAASHTGGGGGDDDSGANRAAGAAAECAVGVQINR